MKQILLSWLLITLCFCTNANTLRSTNTIISATPSAENAMQRFDQTVFNNIKQQYLGQQWVMVLWSVDCPACFKELALVEQLKKTYPQIRIVIVNTDAQNESDVKEERENIISSYHLLNVPNFYFPEGKGDQSRFLIDKNWYGELPRSYFVESDGTFHGKSGIVDKALLMTWLVNPK